jgi:hypothetical protein
MRPEFDARDKEILQKRQVGFDRCEGARVGDFVYFPDGSLHRFTHDWDEDLQTVKVGEGSFYLGAGYVEYSGGLDPAIPRRGLTLLPESREGTCWFFHHNHARAHNGVSVTVNFRVFQYKPEGDGA